MVSTLIENLRNAKRWNWDGIEASNRIEHLESALKIIVKSESHNGAIQLAQIALGSDIKSSIIKRVRTNEWVEGKHLKIRESFILDTRSHDIPKTISE